MTNIFNNYFENNLSIIIVNIRILIDYINFSYIFNNFNNKSKILFCNLYL